MCFTRRLAHYIVPIFNFGPGHRITSIQTQTQCTIQLDNNRLIHHYLKSFKYNKQKHSFINLIGKLRLMSRLVIVTQYSYGFIDINAFEMFLRPHPSHSKFYLVEWRWRNGNPLGLLPASPFRFCVVLQCVDVPNGNI